MRIECYGDYLRDVRRALPDPVRTRAGRLTHVAAAPQVIGLSLILRKIAEAIPLSSTVVVEGAARVPRPPAPPRWRLPTAVRSPARLGRVSQTARYTCGWRARARRR